MQRRGIDCNPGWERGHLSIHLESAIHGNIGACQKATVIAGKKCYNPGDVVRLSDTPQGRLRRYLRFLLEGDPGRRGVLACQIRPVASPHHCAPAGFSGTIDPLSSSEVTERIRSHLQQLDHYGSTDFERMLWLNPSDNQGVRFLLNEMRSKTTWEKSVIR